VLEKTFSFSAVAEKALREFPSFRFRQKNPLIHNASDSGKCVRQLAYKGLKYKESNPTDTVGYFRMSFGNYLESGLKYQLFSKMWPWGVQIASTQGDAGELGTFYGTSWHGFRDFDIAVKQESGKYKRVIVELKTKVGYGAGAMVKVSSYGRNFKVPELDRNWGYPQQLSLYLRNAYLNTKDEPSPVVDGILLYFIHGDGGITGFVEFHAVYNPEKDSVHFYKVESEQFPDCAGTCDETIYLKDIADAWKLVDDAITTKTLPPPTYERRYKVQDPRIDEATKTDLTKATRNQLLLGDTQCKYCSFRDKCAEDLNINLTYATEELKVLKAKLGER
jgi:hypothetical protein